MEHSSENRFQHLCYDVKNGVATITFNCPRRKNAFSLELWSEVIVALRRAAQDDRVVVCVLTGNGDYFSSGNDLNNFINAKKKGVELSEYMVFEGQGILIVYGETLIDFPKQLIAAVNGPALGIGVTVLGLVDVVYASDTATFLTPFTSLGQSPEACSSYTFPKIMGHSKAYEVLYFGRKLTAAEAKESGLVSEVFPAASFQKEVQMRTEKFAALPRKTLQAAKKLCRDGEREQLKRVLYAELEVLGRLSNSEENKQAIQSFFRRKSKM